jgi:hypothetical protein
VEHFYFTLIMLFLDVTSSCEVRSCAWRWRRLPRYVDRKIAPVVGQKFIGCGTVPLVTGARPTAVARQMECIAAALKSPDKSGYSLQRTYALGLAVHGRFD